MAKLSAKDRKTMPKREFGEPGKKAYPMPDAAHAKNAKARAAQAAKAGRMSTAEQHAIDAKADKVIERDEL